MPRTLSPTRLVLLAAAGLVLLLVACLMALAMGPSDASLLEAWRAVLAPARRADSLAYTIIIGQRLPRVALGALVGYSLGLCGAAFQALLRNPLADPYTLGVASGSSVGASLVLALGWTLAWGPLGSVQVGALAGGLLITGLIYRLGVVRRELRIEALLLGGVTVALISSSAILMVRTLSDPFHLMAMDRWMMGSLSWCRPADAWLLAPVVVAGALALQGLAGAFNQLALGEELAHGRGVPAKTVQGWTFVIGSVLTATAVSVAGPIGFVGLVAPHAVRRLVGADHRVLLPCAGLAAATMMVLCDALARTLASPTELPVGVVTALIGGPIFVAILLRRR